MILSLTPPSGRGVCVGSLRLTPTVQTKAVSRVGLIGDSKLSIGVNGCLSLLSTLVLPLPLW